MVVWVVVVAALVAGYASSASGDGGGGVHTEAHEVACDVVVAGGSTASLAAAITAAEADPTLAVCFTEITDWPGGQMTAGWTQQQRGKNGARRESM